MGAALVAAVLLWPRLVSGGESGSGILNARALTDLSGSQAGASLSPDGRSLLYIDNTSGNWDIYWQRIGGEPINLTEDYPENDAYPVFDPSGERIAFNSSRSGVNALFVMGATGERPRKVADRAYHASWSPDGQNLTYTDTNVPNPYSRSGFGRLWVVDVETRETRLLFDQMDAVGPSWSPNGKRIAFWTLHENRRDIFTIPASGGDPVAVTRDDPADFRPFWSPDGGHLYFLSDRGGNVQEAYGPQEDEWTIRNEEDLKAKLPDFYAVYERTAGKTMAAPSLATLQEIGPTRAEELK